MAQRQWKPVLGTPHTRALVRARVPGVGQFVNTYIGHSITTTTTTTTTGTPNTPSSSHHPPLHTFVAGKLTPDGLQLYPVLSFDNPAVSVLAELNSRAANYFFPVPPCPTPSATFRPLLVFQPCEWYDGRSTVLLCRPMLVPITNLRLEHQSFERQDVLLSSESYALIRAFDAFLPPHPRATGAGAGGGGRGGGGGGSGRGGRGGGSAANMDNDSGGSSDTGLSETSYSWLPKTPPIPSLTAMGKMTREERLEKYFRSM